MRSQLILRRTRLLIKHPSVSHRALISSTRAIRYPRKDPARATAPRLSKRDSSSATPTVNDNDADRSEERTQLIAFGASPDPNEPPSEDADKPKQHRGSSVKEPETSSPSLNLPKGLDILWLPNDAPNIETSADGASHPSTSALPPPEVLNEALTNLYITLHPQTQHRATYASPSGPPVEPTLALYCPIEGGDYILDATVRELGRQAGAEVVVLDTVHLAAGECGHFGKAASILQLPNNPLHFAGPNVTRYAPNPAEEEDDDVEDDGPRSGSLTLHVLAPTSSLRAGRASTARKASTSLLKVKNFFDELINTPAPPSEGSSEPGARPPRIIYVRDFTTLAASSPSWYPALLSAVRARRQGPLPRQSSPVHSPTTIIFGITPPIVSQGLHGSSGSGSPGLLSYLMSRQNVSVSVPAPKSGKSENSEDEAAEKARERRLKERLRKWERGDPTLHHELPQLVSSSESEEGSGRNSGVIVVDGDGDSPPSGLPSFLAQALGGRLNGRSDSSSDGERTTKFYRTSFIVPGTRSLHMEKACRIARRREINELTTRMGVASVGGVLPPLDPKPDVTAPAEGSEQSPTLRQMWETWGREVEKWSNVLKIADHAVGKAIAASVKDRVASAKASLEPVPVEWGSVLDAWAAHKAARDMRKAWVQHSVPKASEQDDEKAEGRSADEEHVDEVIERLKRDPDLDSHEQRLLGCIVDTGSISTTFNHVHLPPRTIDSVRTIVSLPLLHPGAFQHGILKEHAMTGCLLFGPPGTGKTLVVRALAKEAGCRMLAVSPSDVMDMYVGEGEKLVRSVFSLARRLSPCVVFIDELDALFGARSSARESGGAIAHRGVLTEFMQEMDGLKSSKDDNIIVIGATNRPFDLDDAILRRLPRRLLVDLPGEKEREEILKILLRDETLASDVDFKVLAKKTESFSGSDLKHLCVSAALDAVKEKVDVPWRPPKLEIPSSEVTATTVATSATTVDAPATTPAPDAAPQEATPESTQAAVAEAPQTSELSAAAAADASPDAAASTTEPAVAPAEASSPELTLDDLPPLPELPPTPTRVLHWRNFETALKEITPSSSESLGTLADLRKWNEEFGEGRKDKKHKSVWGKGKFGFIPKPVGGDGEGKVADPSVDGKKSGGVAGEAR